jgi:hypothetical protein
MKDERKMRIRGWGRKESGTRLMVGRLLVMRRKMREQVLMSMGIPRDRTMPCRVCMENTIGRAPFGHGGRGVR